MKLVINILLNYCTLLMQNTIVGGHFLETLTKRFDESYKGKRERDAGNAVLVFVHVYNFGV